MDEEPESAVVMGAYGGPARPVESAAGETMLLWSLGNPASHRPNAFVRHGAGALAIDACGRRLTLHQSPSNFMGASGMTGAVVWDSGVVLAKFLEHAADRGLLAVRGTRAVELGAGCGLVGVVAALLGARVVATDLPDRLRLLRKNLGPGDGDARVAELVWGEDDDPVPELLHPDLVLGSDVVYSEEAVDDLLATLSLLAGQNTTVLPGGGDGGVRDRVHRAGAVAPRLPHQPRRHLHPRQKETSHPSHLILTVCDSISERNSTANLLLGTD
ncbi:hypothetical protein ACQ4PT_022798 [Festuca glaucescens]